METEIEIVGALDQPIPLPIQGALEDVDYIISQARTSGDGNDILDEAEAYLQRTRVSGLALCKLLYHAEKIWNEWGQADFMEMFSDRLGLGTTTINRYISVWSVYERKEIPAKLTDNFLQKPLRSQIPIAKLIEQGYTPSQDQWQQLAYAPDLSTTARLVRDIKHTEPRKSAMMIFVDQKGNLTAVQDGKIVSLGYLNVAGLADELTAKAIKRIVNDARIMEKI